MKIRSQLSFFGYIPMNVQSCESTLGFQVAANLENDLRGMPRLEAWVKRSFACFLCCHGRGGAGTMMPQVP